VRQNKRLDSILTRLSEHGSVEVTGLAEDLGVSMATIRRDLELLESQRLLSRTHGGAVSHGVLYELPLRYRSGRHEAEKHRIADAAISRLDDARVVGLTGGTTTTEVARRLAGRTLTVVTNALNIAAELAVRPNLKLLVTGGVARPESYELVGPLADRTLDELNIDVVFVGVDGASGAGMTTYHEVEAHTNRRMIERARRVVVVCDASKVGRSALAVICPARDVDELITDPTADEAALAELQAAGVSVLRV
jgi:DeoR family transcriptional regulator, aga operon transcriptional repressor